jgi:hypothetical protein
MTAGSVWADLQDLKKDVQTSEQSKDKKAPEAAPASTPASGSSNDGFGAFVAKVVALLWAADNVGTTFGAHPYDEHGWVRIAPWTAATDPTSPPLLTGRDQWWSAEAQVFSLDGLGTGVWTAWKGHLWRFFGPSFEGWTLTDGAQLLSGGRAGLTFSLVQGDPFNLSVYLQAQGWTGALVRGGGSGGLELRSYPLDPLEVQVRLGVQGFDGFQIGEFEAQAGWNFGAITAFGGFRSWGLGDGSAKPPTSVYAGPFGGVRWYF